MRAGVKSAPVGADGASMEGRAHPLSWKHQPRSEDGGYVRVGRRELPALTSLRFVAAAYVVVHHLINFADSYRYGDAGRPAAEQHWYLTWGMQGHVGVTFFFVLSGFILAWCYHAAFSECERGGGTAERFWLARFARVWPLHALTFLWFVPLAVLGAGGVSELLRVGWTGALNLTLLHGWVPLGSVDDGISQTFNSPAWTLSVEALFYAICPLLLWALVAKARWGVAQLLALGVGGWAALGAVGALLGGWDHAYWALRIFPPGRIPDFLLGICLGLVFVQLAQRRELGGRAEPGRTSATWTAVEVGALALAAASPLVWSTVLDGAVPKTLQTSFVHLPVLAALVFVFGVGRGALSRGIFSSRTFVWLGEVSFTIYLVHLFLLRVALKGGAYDRLGVPLTTALLVVAILTLSAACHHWFERPARARIAGWHKRRLAARVDAAAEVGELPALALSDDERRAS